MTPQSPSRRDLLNAAVGGAVALSCATRSRADEELCRDDVAIDRHTALLFPKTAPLVPAAGKRDARAVWSRVPGHPDRSVLIYLHGHNNYVTVDASGRSRVPDWATTREAQEGAASKPATPLAYGLDRLEERKTGKNPVVLVPEVSVLTSGSFWAREPAGQYADADGARLGALLADCLDHLACLHCPHGTPYLPPAALKDPRTGKPHLARIYLAGHSGAGLPLEKAARSACLTPGMQVPSELWLFDCTYWSETRGFVEYCRRWQAAGRLTGGRRDCARFVCVYRPKTQTEEVADQLRIELAKILGVAAETLVRDHTSANYEAEVRPALAKSGVLFVRTTLPHDEIPTFFIPALLHTAAS